MSRVTTIIGPEDHGRRMTLEEFEDAHPREGWIYELANGEVVVVDVPSPRHQVICAFLREELAFYRKSNPGVIFTICTGSECKIVLPKDESERHPDLAVYKTSPPQTNVWANWIPEFVIEVVSPGSEHRDYNETPDDYWDACIKEYWIIDSQKMRIAALRRSPDGWVTSALGEGDRIESATLPGFAVDCTAILNA